MTDQQKDSSFSSLPTKQQQETEQEFQPPPTAALLTGAAGAFGAGLLGAIWYTKRKQNKRMQLEILEGNVPLPASKVSIPQYIPPKMTPAEFAKAKKDASFFAFKTLGYGTLLAFTGAGLLATAVGYWLDVRNFKEFSDKLAVIVPKKTASLRQMLGGKKLEMTREEEAELDSIDMESD